MAEAPNLIHVEIFGLTYTVRAGAEPGYVEQLAAYVDQQMREVSRASGAVDSVRIAVLAALNLADELFRLRDQTAQDGTVERSSAERQVKDRATRLARELGAALDE
jgi:cell division protein ZapA